MKTHPVMLKLEGHTVLVVGCGEVGMRKVGDLLDSGAVVRLVCLQDDPGRIEAVEIIRGEYYREHLEGAVLVFACTNSPELNSRIAADAREKGIPVNAADQPDDCDFFSPAIFRAGDLVVAVGSGNSAPGLSGMVKNHISEFLPAGLGKFAAVLKEARDYLRERVGESRRRMEIMRSLSTWEMFEAWKKSGRAEVFRRLEGILEGKDYFAKTAGRIPLLFAGSMSTLLLCGLSAAFFPGLLKLTHVIVAVLSLVFTGMSGWWGLQYLRINSGLKCRDVSLLIGHAPPLEKIDRNCRACLTYGFLCFTLAIALGIMQAGKGWLEDWTNHPKAACAVSGWIICFLAVAAAWSPRFRGKRTAVLSMVGLVFILMVMAISLVT